MGAMFSKDGPISKFGKSPIKTASDAELEPGDGIPTRMSGGMFGSEGDLKMSQNDIAFIRNNQDKAGNSRANRASNMLSSGSSAPATGTKTLLGN